VLGPLNDWIGLLFARENIDRTVAALAGSQGGVGGTSNAREASRHGSPRPRCGCGDCRQPSRHVLIRWH
jgi:hypothetical protein